MNYLKNCRYHILLNNFMLHLIQRCDVLAGRITIIRHVCCPLRVTSVTPPSHPVGVIRSPRRPSDVLLCPWSNLLCYRPDVVAWSVGYAVIYNIFKRWLSAERFLSIRSKFFSYIVIRTRCIVSECVLEYFHEALHKIKLVSGNDKLIFSRGKFNLVETGTLITPWETSPENAKNVR